VASQMTIRTKVSIITILLVFTIGYLPAPVSASGGSVTPSELSTLASIIDSYKNGQPDIPRELYIDDLITLPIVQQPRGNSTFVSPLQNYLTEFQTASNFGTVGLLAHNYLAGRYFVQILPGQEIRLVYGDGRTERFVVTEIQRYQALVPDSPSSDFVDLTSGEYLTAAQLFKKVYGNQSGHLILQTCIDAEQNPSWGRLFIIAESADQSTAKR
jgi:hypothetical protein